jgi:hypothetical protein
MAMGLKLGDHPYRMDDTGDVSQKGQQDIDPEMLPDSYLKKYAQWGQKYGRDDSKDIHSFFLSFLMVRRALPDCFVYSAFRERARK